MSEHDDFYYDAADEAFDELEEALRDCQMFEEGGFWRCGAAGSEHCSCRCPFAKKVGAPTG